MNHPLIERLEGVKRNGSHRYLARCPAHEDRSPSLSIYLPDDGKVLVHCFAGCVPADILAAVGMSLADLFPKDHRKELLEREQHITQARRHEHRRTELSHAVAVLIVAESDRKTGVPIAGDDIPTVRSALEKVRKATAEEIGRLPAEYQQVAKGIR